jgi:hypothetical protein
MEIDPTELPNEEKITINEVKILISSFLIPEIIFEVMTGYSGAKKHKRSIYAAQYISNLTSVKIIRIVFISL